jgi:hypothetical protein
MRHGIKHLFSGKCQESVPGERSETYPVANGGTVRLETKHERV